MTGPSRCPGRTPSPVERQVEAQRPDDVDVAVVERAQRPPVLRQLIDEDDDRGDRQPAQRRAPGERLAQRPSRREATLSSPADPADLLLDEHRRPRDRLEALPGIGRPDTTE